MVCTLCLLLHPVCTGPLPELGLAAGAPVASVRHTALALGREAVVTSIVQIADCVTNAHAPLPLNVSESHSQSEGARKHLNSNRIGGLVFPRKFSDRAPPGPAEAREGPAQEAAAGGRSKSNGAPAPNFYTYGFSA